MDMVMDISPNIMKKKRLRAMCLLGSLACLILKIGKMADQALLKNLYFA